MNTLTRYIPLFKKQAVLVIGDVMMDKYVWGKVARISPEAPVPVVEVVRESQTVGGAGNVAHNMACLGGRVAVIGVVGADAAAEQLKDDLRSKRINVDGIITANDRPTSNKTRIIASHQQVVRIDREIKGAFEQTVETEIVRRLEAAIPDVQALIISDYGKGVISQRVLKRAITLARKHGIPITVDPKIEHFTRYRRVSCITPNTAEAIAGMRYRDVSSDDDIRVLGGKIMKKLAAHSVLITRGEKGMMLFEPGNRVTAIPTRAKEVFDVSGAGDTVIATFTLALAAKASFRTAAEIANFAAGIVVGKIGTATVTPDELRAAIADFHARS